ncbi:MAG TPA: hypothetical protein VIC55_04640, partial [Gemmatimonadaceae bacterium]
DEAGGVQVDIVRHGSSLEAGTRNTSTGTTVGHPFGSHTCTAHAVRRARCMCVPAITIVYRWIKKILWPSS